MHTKCSEVEILRAVCEFCATDVFFVYFPMFLYLYSALKCATDPTHFFFRLHFEGILFQREISTMFFYFKRTVSLFISYNIIFYR